MDAGIEVVHLRLQRSLEPVAPPRSRHGFRLGELTLVPRDAERLTRDRLARGIRASGYVTLEGTEDWQHFRPRTAWWQGIRRHAKLRDRRLHVLLEDDADGLRVKLAGLLTPALEHYLAGLGAIYALVSAPGG